MGINGNHRMLVSKGDDDVYAGGVAKERDDVHSLARNDVSLVGCLDFSLNIEVSGEKRDLSERTR